MNIKEERDSEREESSGSPMARPTAPTLPIVKLTAASADPPVTAKAKDEGGPSTHPEKAEINDTVTKVLQSYNWSLVHSPSK